MVILYGQTSKCECLPKHTALEDIWLALDMLPRFRWRWERKDANGGHPLIAKVAERVLEVDLQTLHPESVTSPILLPEPAWDYVSSSPTSVCHQPIAAPYEASRPVQSNGHANPSVYGPRPRPVDSGTPSDVTKGGDTTPPEKSMASFPTTLFYPFYPEAALPANQAGGSSNTSSGSSYQEYLNVAAKTQDGLYANHSAHETFIDDTQHRAQQQQQVNIWASVGEYRPA